MGNLADQRRSSVASFFRISDALVGSDVRNIDDFEMTYAWEREFDSALSTTQEISLSNETLTPPKLANESS